MAALTKWFPPDVKPVRKGWYETRASFDEVFAQMAYWTGTKWKWEPSGHYSVFFQDRYWRGLKAPAK